jgi:prolyl 4-hydroxylase
MEKYVAEVVAIEESYKSVRAECKNRHPQCAFWASQGECEANPKYMVLQCAPVCQTCDKIDFEARCPYDKNAPSILEKEGDLHALFEKITTDPVYAEYRPVIHSSPNDEEAGPWIVTLENFMSQEECENLIQLGADVGYERSKDVGARKFDGTYDGFENNGRTSHNAWCTDHCYNDTLTQQVIRRIENVTGVPDSNSEYLQLLRYDVGQYYHVSTVCGLTMKEHKLTVRCCGYTQVNPIVSVSNLIRLCTSLDRHTMISSRIKSIARREFAF